MGAIFFPEAEPYEVGSAKRLKHLTLKSEISRVCSILMLDYQIFESQLILLLPPGVVVVVVCFVGSSSGIGTREFLEGYEKNTSLKLLMS